MQSALEELQRLAIDKARVELEESRERLRKAKAEADVAEMQRTAAAKALKQYERGMGLPDLPKGVS